MYGKISFYYVHKEVNLVLYNYLWICPVGWVIFMPNNQMQFLANKSMLNSHDPDTFTLVSYIRHTYCTQCCIEGETTKEGYWLWQLNHIIDRQLWHANSITLKKIMTASVTQYIWHCNFQYKDFWFSWVIFWFSLKLN